MFCFSASTDVQLNSTLQPYLTDKSGEVLLTATWQLACQQSIDCDALVDSLVLRCRGAGDVIEGRSQCDDVMSEGDVSVMGRELSQYQCNITAFSIDGITLATNVINVSTPQSGEQWVKLLKINIITYNVFLADVQNFECLYFPLAQFFFFTHM